VTGVPSFDGKRAVSPSFQQQIDATIDDLIAAFDVPVIRLDVRHRDGWIGRVLDVLALPSQAPQIDLFVSPQ
jgi:hypothetical protein